MAALADKFGLNELLGRWPMTENNMEPMPQLEAWSQQLADNPNAKAADVDVAKRLLEHGIEALEELKRLRETLQGIADADWRKWEELATPEEFVRWAKARAMHALRPNT